MTAQGPSSVQKALFDAVKRGRLAEVQIALTVTLTH